MTAFQLDPRFDTLLGLVERYSPSGQEAPAVDWLVGRMRSVGYTRAYADAAGNAVGLIGEGPRQAVLLGHIDTVPGQIPLRMSGERLFGRGTVDAKGPLAAFVDAAVQAGPRPGWQIAVIGAVGEEADSPGARHAASNFNPEFTVIGEPSGWDRITLGYKGSAWAEITVRRSRAHPAGPNKSACEAAFEIWAEMHRWAEAYNTGRERVFERLSPSLRGTDSGLEGDEEWCRLCVDARLPLELQPQDWYDVLFELAAGAEVRPAGFPIPAYRSGKNTPLVKAFLSGIRGAGGKPGFLVKSGTADLNIVAPQWGCLAAAYGPGDSTLDHTADEHISLDEYLLSVEVMRQVLLETTAA
jgi:[amino group carrier protein]-lysine/ornithine hydrolase